MLEAALAEQVHNAASGLQDPIGRAVLVNKPQHLYASQQTVALRPISNTPYAILLAVRYHGRCNLHAVHVQVRQQRLHNAQLLLIGETHARCLLTVTQRGIQNLDITPANRTALIRLDIGLTTKQIIDIVIAIQKAVLLVGVNLKFLTVSRSKTGYGLTLQVHPYNGTGILLYA